jgi:Tol biopolymer transport system component
MRPSLCALVALAAACGAVPAAAPAASASRNGLIAYSLAPYAPGAKGSLYAGPGDIHLVQADGKNDRALTSGPDDDYEPAFSPDGRRVAFTRGTNGALYVIDVDGGGLTRIASPASGVDAATWSPDGSSLAFDGARGIYVVRASGHRLHRITRPPRGYLDFVPSWSPRGSTIVFTRGHFDSRGRDVAERLWAVKPNGRGAHPLLGGSGALRFSQQADVAPNGRRVVFGASRPNGKGGIFQAKLDGSGVRRVLAAPRGGFLNGPAYSPDGREVVVTEAHGHDARAGASLVVVNLKTRAHRAILSVPQGMVSSPSWQPIH